MKTRRPSRSFTFSTGERAITCLRAPTSTPSASAAAYSAAIDTQTTPLVLSDQQRRPFTLRYVPTLDQDGVARSGVITFTYNGRTVQLPLPREKFDSRTSFNRFGLREDSCGGSWYQPFVDDLSYTAAVP